LLVLSSFRRHSRATTTTSPLPHRYPDRFNFLGRLSLDNPASRQLLANWGGDDTGLGFRLALPTVTDQANFETGAMDWIWPEAQRVGVPLMVFAPPALLPAMKTIAQRYPDLRLVLDHLSVPANQPWARDERAFEHLPSLLALADCPNVAVKATGMPNYSTHAYPYRNLHRFLETAFDAFGPRRMFWGSDYFAGLAGPYRETVTMFTQELPWLTGTDLELVMGRALMIWLDWPDDPIG
jgi:L-fuconolactonase